MKSPHPITASEFSDFSPDGVPAVGTDSLGWASAVPLPKSRRDDRRIARHGTERALARAVECRVRAKTVFERSRVFLPRGKNGAAAFASRRTHGFTLIELVLAVSILLILATAALPLTRVVVKRRKETDLRYSLLQIRRAIDRYKDAADKNQIQVKAGTEGYPPDLDTLVKGVQLTGASDKRVHFLAKIPKDPMTGNAEWGMRSVQDDTDSTSWGGQDVFDVYTKSTGTALDGSKYSDW